MNIGEKVYVAGRTMYRGIRCNVNSYGTIAHIGSGSYLVSLNDIKNDEYRIVSVRKEYIFKVAVA